MRRTAGLSTLAVLALAAPAWAGFGLCCKPHCIVAPPPACPDCPCPCDHRLSLTLFGPEHARKLSETLSCGDCCCERIHAAKKLGCRLHADYCCDPCVLDALVGALLCDPCWEVRRAAAWSLMLQNARTDRAVRALYLSSKLDPHYMVRSRAAEALDILTLCRRGCFKELYASADELIKQLRAVKYVPGSPGCKVLFTQACAGGGLSATLEAAPAHPALAPAPAAPPAPRITSKLDLCGPHLVP
jgi:hypothetical protein